MKLDLRALENPFPPVHLADADGVLTVSEFISPELTITAYLNGIFPWPVEEQYILWFAPPKRSIIQFDDFHVPHGARRELKKKKFTFSVNQHFPQVIHGCANAPRGDHGTWITEKMIRAYRGLNRLGVAMSFETLDESGQLVGGLYGIRIGRYFSGESMFFIEPGASKFALINTVEFLKKEYGCTWLDSQVKNSFTGMFGAVEVSRDKFMHLHSEAIDL